MPVRPPRSMSEIFQRNFITLVNAESIISENIIALLIKFHSGSYPCSIVPILSDLFDFFSKMVRHTKKKLRDKEEL